MITTFDPASVRTADFHALMLSAVAPRPIAFASTISRQGDINLSPFSFFNAFGSKPPTLIFSPARRVRDNTIKHTLENVYDVPEVVINIVDYPIVEQMSLSSTEYERGVNEFVKAGLTELASTRVRPPRVAEAPVQFECAVRRIIPLGSEGGAGNLIVCEILLAHVRSELLDAQGRIDQRKIDLVARLGGDWYARASGQALFEVEKPLVRKGIGIDRLPAAIRESHVLTGNDLARLANVEQLPVMEELAEVEVQVPFRADAHTTARWLLSQGKVREAWKVLLG